MGVPVISDESGSVLLIGGLLVAAAAYLWLVVRAFRIRTGWGVAGVLIPPAGGLAFGLVHRRRAALPLFVALLGLAAAAAPIAATRLIAPALDLGERNKIVDGERHLTLTGWGKTDYAVLAGFQDVVVLQMANPDVTDATLAHVVPLAKVKELDLNDSRITDAGLATLAALPALESLRVARTGVSADGLAKTALTWPKLRQLDVTGLDVPAKVLRDWKNADPANRAYVK